MDMARGKTIAVVVAFLLAAGWFFVPVGRPEGESLLFAMRLALPTTLLAVGNIGLIPWLMAMGFCFCAVGDALGVAGSFEGQMGGFAVAHICFICQFAKDIRASKPKTGVLVASTLLCLLLIAFAMLKIIPAIRDLPIRIGCIVYAFLLTGTAWTSIVRAVSQGVRRALPCYIAAVGGLLFLASDFILSWHKFAGRIPQASLYIMTTYYAALLCLFLGTLRRKA